MGGKLTEDKFTKLVTDPEKPLARISISVGEGLEYGSLKVSANVTLSCDQNEETIDKALELAFYKALEAERDGFGELGVDMKGQ